MPVKSVGAAGARLAFAVSLALSVVGNARAEVLEIKDIKLGVGGASALYYLPLALTEKLDRFEAPRVRRAQAKDHRQTCP